ncbi:MAG: multidrug effflux MFS transporter, partial [Geminicoccaceae bacterium]
SLPHLPALLDTTEQAAKMTMSLNLAAFALAQLVHGPLADSLGRRTVLVMGITAFSVASALCALAPSITLLIGGRTLQGLLSSVPSVVVLLLIHELYAKDKAVRILGFHGMAVAVAPIVGPLIGGIIFVHFGWRANFWLLAAFAALVAVLVYRHVPETLQRPVPVKVGSVIANYLKVISRRAVLSHLLPLAAVFGALFAFVTSGPFILIDRYDIPTKHYGLYYGTVCLTVIVGGAIANGFGGRISTERLEASAFLLAISGVAVAGWSTIFGDESPLSLTISMSIFAIGLGLMLATGPILLLEAVDDRLKSSASAIAGSTQLVAASVASFLVAAFHDGTSTPMLLTMGGLLAIGTLGFALKDRRIRPFERV